MIRTLAIDDEPLALQQLAAYIKKIPYLELVGECQSAIDAHTLMQKEPVDAIFCDISMPDLNGLDFVRALNPRPLVVFTTAYSQYAVEGYKVDADDYLLKPFSFEEFQQAAERVHRQYDLLHQEEAAAASASEIDENDDIFLKTEYKVMRVHRSWMVNLRRIREISKSRITLDNDAEVPIGDLYRETFQKYIESKFVGK